MKIEYILILKKQTKQNNKEDIENKINDILKNCFTDVQKDEFSFKIKKTTHKIKYTIITQKTTEKKEFVQNLVFSTDLPIAKGKQAEVLENLHNSFIGCDVNNEFYKIVSYDEISKYYCNLASPLFQDFERHIRNLVYKIVIKPFGVKWVDKTMNKDMKDKIVENIKAKTNKKDNDDSYIFVKLIEEGLQELTIGELEAFLFTQKENSDPKRIIDEKLSVELIKNMNKEEIVSILDSARAKSLWDKYFSKHIKIDDVQNKVKRIGKLRNQVAHCKKFFKKDYEEAIELLKNEGLIESLEMASNEVDKIALSEKLMFEIIEELRIKSNERATDCIEKGEKIRQSINANFVTPLLSATTSIMKWYNSITPPLLKMPREPQDENEE